MKKATLLLATLVVGSSLVLALSNTGNPGDSGTRASWKGRKGGGKKTRSPKGPRLTESRAAIQ